ncbi:MAG: hypothetical protein GC189_10310 [Alphaproteobacteria bacterium]|nr:hypothetical protein [Alphaproteobacteria bacterium]
MKTFLAVFTGSQASFERAGWAALAPEERQRREAEGMAAWGAWMEQHAGILAFEGGPLGKTKSVDKTGISDISNDLAGFVVVRAESQDAAAKLFEGHPHFMIFPGKSVEIMEITPIPGQ